MDHNADYCCWDLPQQTARNCSPPSALIKTLKELPSISCLVRSLSQHSPHLTHALHCPTKFIPKFVPHVIRTSPGSLLLSPDESRPLSLPPSPTGEERMLCRPRTLMLGGQLRSHSSLTRVRSPYPMKNAETYVGTKHQGIRDTGWCVGSGTKVKKGATRWPKQLKSSLAAPRHR